MGTMLDMLKIDLGIVTNAYDLRLMQYLETAQAEIQKEGATLDLSAVADMQLCVMYAAWLWRRRDTMAAMPRMVRYLLNNRVFGEKMRG